MIGKYTGYSTSLILPLWNNSLFTAFKSSVDWKLTEQAISIYFDWKAVGERWVEGCIKEIELHR